jgi:hypothetical protein
LNELTPDEQEFFADIARRVSEMSHVTVGFSVQADKGQAWASFYLSIDRRHIPSKGGVKTGSLEPTIESEQVFDAPS